VRIKDILNCSRRMFFENAVEGYEYSGRGTCFLCRYRKVDFAVTVNHVVRGYDADSIRVLFHSAAREFVPHNAQITIETDEDDRSEDDDWRDLAIFPLEGSLYGDKQFADQPPYVILSADHVWRPGMSGRFITKGFPHDQSYVDYDALVLREQAVIPETSPTARQSAKNCAVVTRFFLPS
jgi:hypothetical protein